jgi:CRISPR-associated protein Cas1
MSSLYLDRRNLALKLEGRTLTIYADGVHQTTVPLHMLERVVFYSAVQIESSLLLLRHIFSLGARHSSCCFA